MAIATRTAVTNWSGALADGSGTIDAGSGALRDQAVTWAARTEAPSGKTSPEELAAAAHSSCFAMALSLKLGEAKAPPQTLEVEAAVTLDEVDGKPTITTSALTVTGKVPGLDDAQFQRIVNEAAALCPVSRLFAGAQVSVQARLADA